MSTEQPRGTRSQPILYWNRATGKTAEELIYGEGFMRWIYETPAGRFFADALFCRPVFSRLYGAYKRTRASASAIPGFVKRFDIRMEEFEAGDFRSFNDFFIRRFKPGARRFSEKPEELCAFAEGRYLAFEQLTEGQRFPVKSAAMSPEGLLSDGENGGEKARLFAGGPVLVARLCPTDYHRFHYPDDGVTVEAYPIPGKLHSVNPLALKTRADVFVTNERRVSILRTKNFGDLAYVEVGAICVGKIVQTRSELEPFCRGDEKGYFLFGGSTVIVLGEPGAWRPDADLLEQTRLGRETLVRLGERVAKKCGQ
ncbi:MAG: phosphatidylserine decarboxylase [Deltaproteobacteria bacterium]|nr:phosphatidylserine decarboxylase [Deltaproteobacteria bacterium]